jgi:dihydropteroate synthase
MGILNVTPDSFSGDGVLRQGGDWVERAVAQVRQCFADGADLIDIGGESTRPGSATVSAEEEIRRVVPVVQRLVAEGLGPISIDTYKAEVAGAALEAGADLINDIMALRGDPSMASVVVEHRAPVVLMHNASRPEQVATDPKWGSTYLGTEHADFLADIIRELQEIIALARQAGIPDDLIVTDPGIGFGKTQEQNLELIDRVSEVRALGYPVLVGPSRKSFVGQTLGLPSNERLEGTAAAVAIAIARGADIVRVHDVKMMVRVARLSDAVVRHPGPLSSREDP